MHRTPHGVTSGRSPRRWIPALLLTLVFVAPAGAAVVVEQTSETKGLGGFGEGTSKSTLIIAGDKSRSEDDYKYTGRFKTFAGGNKKSVSITRLDQEVIWNLDVKEKSYTETTFQEMRDILSGKAGGPFSQAQAQEMPDEQDPADVAMECTTEADETGASETINGFACTQLKFVIRCDPKDPEVAAAQAASPGLMIVDIWVAKDLPEAEEVRAYHKAYAERLGLSAELAGASGMARRMLGMAMGELKEKFQSLDGYPIRTTFTIEKAPMSEEQQKAFDAALAEADAARKESEAEAEKDAAKSAAAGDVSGGAAGLLGNKLSGMFARKSQDSAKKSTEEPWFRVVTEVKSIKSTNVDKVDFDIPDGYKKIEKPW